MNSLKIKPAEIFEKGIHILEKVGEDYNPGSIYSEDGDNIHCFILGTGRKTIAKADAHQIFATIENVDYLYTESTDVIKTAVEFLKETRPTLMIPNEATKEEADNLIQVYADLLYPYLDKEKKALDHKLEINEDRVCIDKSSGINNKELGMLIENIGKQHISLEKKAITLQQAIGLKGYKITQM